MVLAPGEIVSIVSVAMMLVYNTIIITKSTKKDNSDNGKAYGQILTQLGYLQGQVESLNAKIDCQNDKHFALAERVGRVEESSKSAHKRIDRMEDIETRSERE